MSMLGFATLYDGRKCDYIGHCEPDTENIAVHHDKNACYYVMWKNKTDVLDTACMAEHSEQLSSIAYVVQWHISSTDGIYVIRHTCLQKLESRLW